MEIQVSVTDRIAKLVNKDDFMINGNSDYTIRFTFDSEWSGRTAKTARFIYVRSYIKNELTYREVAFEGDTVSVPLFHDLSCLVVGVYSGNLVTTTPCHIPVKASILDGDPIHDAPQEDVYNQIMSLLGERVEEAPEDGNQYARKNGEWVEVSGGSPAKHLHKITFNNLISTQTADLTISYLTDRATSYTNMEDWILDGAENKLVIINSVWNKTNFFAISTDVGFYKLGGPGGPDNPTWWMPHSAYVSMNNTYAYTGISPAIYPGYVTFNDAVVY